MPRTNKPTDKLNPYDPSPRASVSRREFARRAAFGTAGLLAYPALDQSASTVPTLPEISVDPKTAAQSAPNASNLSPQSQAEAQSRYQTILTQYPDRFSDAQKADVKRLCLLIQPPLDRLRAYNISNGDLPALYLKPLVDRDKRPAASPKPSTPGKP
jgi:hypothetical protein